MKSGTLFFIGTMLLSFLSCEISDLDSRSMNVTFTVPKPDNYEVQQEARFTVLWTGRNVWEVTADGPVSPGSPEVTIPIDTPPYDILEKVKPAETLAYSSYNLPNTPTRRPRIVIYDDLNQNQQFDLDADRIMALDGYGLSYYASVLAILDVDSFLSQLSIEETQIYYSWTNNEYSQLLYGSADPGWSNYVTPLFEDTSLVEFPKLRPVLELQTSNDLLLQKDLECFRNTSTTYDFTYEQIWVDSTLAVDAICAETTTPCGPFDAGIEPDFEQMAQSAQLFRKTCGLENAEYQPIAANIGEIQCTDCTCAVTYEVVAYYLNTEMIPLWSPCFAQSSDPVTQ